MLGLNVEQALNAVRSHWQVESMHWMLDMNFREDESRIRKKQGPLVFNVMRKIAMALFKRGEGSEGWQDAQYPRTIGFRCNDFSVLMSLVKQNLALAYAPDFIAEHNYRV